MSIGPSPPRRLARLLNPLFIALAAGAGCSGDEPAAEGGEVTTNPGETGMTSTTGSTEDPPDLPGADDGDEPICGDGELDPGEDCDDGNLLEGDGCTPSCELGPCAWEWVSREPALNLSDDQNFYVVSPMTLDGEQALITHATGPSGEGGTRLLRTSTADGSIVTTADLDVAPGDDIVYGLARDPSGDLFIGHSRFDAGLTEIRRLSPDGEQLWLYTRAAEDYLAGLEYAASDELVFVTTIDVNDGDSDVLIVGVDPSDGSELWSQTHSGPLAPNNYSLDSGAGLVTDDQGRRFVAINEYRDWDTVTPVIAAYAPGDSGAPLWVSEVDLPNEVLTIFALALGPAGSVVVGFISSDTTQPFAIASFEAETGAPLWLFERDQIEGDFDYSLLRGLAASEDRLMAVGYWRREIDGKPTFETYALGLNPDGTQACLATITGDDLGEPSVGLLASALMTTASGFHVAGFTTDSEGTQVDLMQAMLR